MFVGHDISFKLGPHFLSAYGYVCGSYHVLRKPTFSFPHNRDLFKEEKFWSQIL
ncbi:Uncharacterized protein APZ42_032802 [Daphnia magna]|uniref:Uncharacterized protein n=1 Tax=Daphnia magna TaxID=35525 RepID=A0A0P6BB82_9CRUS|nr:Uncharacterized protein APZ42_032802 [Daphnia magna]